MILRALFSSFSYHRNRNHDILNSFKSNPTFAYSLHYLPPKIHQFPTLSLASFKSHHGDHHHFSVNFVLGLFPGPHALSSHVLPVYRPCPLPPLICHSIPSIPF